jgi:hypothetical protein
VLIASLLIYIFYKNEKDAKDDRYSLKSSGRESLVNQFDSVGSSSHLGLAHSLLDKIKDRSKSQNSTILKEN